MYTIKFKFIVAISFMVFVSGCGLSGDNNNRKVKYKARLVDSENPLLVFYTKKNGETKGSSGEDGVFEKSISIDTEEVKEVCLKGSESPGFGAVQGQVQVEIIVDGEEEESGFGRDEVEVCTLL
jgi:hypothetical protein